MSLEHGRDVCGGAAWCAACNARMIEREGKALRMAVYAAQNGSKRVHKRYTDEAIAARVERRWRDDRAYSRGWRARIDAVAGR